MQRTSYAVWIWWPEASTCRWDVSCLDRNRRRQLTQNVMHWCLSRFTARQIRTSTVNTPDRAMLQIDSCYGDLFWLIGRYWRLWKGNRTRGHPWEYQKTCCVSSTVWCTSLGLNISSFSWLLPTCMHKFTSKQSLSPDCISPDVEYGVSGQTNDDSGKFGKKFLLRTNVNFCFRRLQFSANSLTSTPRS